MKILFLCRERDADRERTGYVRAFRKRGTQIIFVDEACSVDVGIDRLLERSPDKPDLIVQPDSAFPLLPHGLATVGIPTACFHFDPYAYQHRRTRWAMLFDYAFLFHPGSEGAFRQSGHPNPLTIPHAVDADFFQTNQENRSLDLGWVGRTDGPVYTTRRRVLEQLSAHFRINQWKQPHSYQELAKVYCASKIVSNVGRDDYPADVSLRFAEAMAAGALFVTLLPSEMTQLGFQDGVHFVGVNAEEEFRGAVRHYLEHEAERRKIAEAGRQKVLREHTYDCRVDAMIRILQANDGNLFAPARTWPDERIRLVYLDYFAAHFQMDCAFQELRSIARRSLAKAARGAYLIARARASRSKSRLKARFHHLQRDASAEAS